MGAPPEAETAGEAAPEAAPAYRKRQSTLGQPNLARQASRKSIGGLLAMSMGEVVAEDEAKKKAEEGRQAARKSLSGLLAMSMGDVVAQDEAKKKEEDGRQAARKSIGNLLAMSFEAPAAEPAKPEPAKPEPAEDPNEQHRVTILGRLSALTENQVTMLKGKVQSSVARAIGLPLTAVRVP